MNITLKTEVRRRHATLLLAAALITGSAAPSTAAVILPSVAPGTQYRIVFTTTNGYQSYNPLNTSQTRSVAYWDGIVNAEADLSSEPTVQNATFHVVGAIFDGGTNQTAQTVSGMTAADSIPIYNTKGELVASGSTQFWSQTHVGAMNGDRNGATLNTNYYNAWLDTLPTFRPFGHGGQTFWSNNSTNIAPWATGSTIGSSSFLRVAGISEPITAVPEPTGLLLCGISGLGFVLRRRRP
jgi:hypothetical protein